MTTKVPSVWNPQPLGYGYVTQTTPLQLVDQNGGKLVDQNGAGLKTGLQSVVGKFRTLWSNTGV